MDAGRLSLVERLASGRIGILGVLRPCRSWQPPRNPTSTCSRDGNDSAKTSGCGSASMLPRQKSGRRQAASSGRSSLPTSIPRCCFSADPASAKGRSQERSIINHGTAVGRQRSTPSPRRRRAKRVSVWRRRSVDSIRSRSVDPSPTTTCTEGNSEGPGSRRTNPLDANGACWRRNGISWSRALAEGKLHHSFYHLLTRHVITSATASRTARRRRRLRGVVLETASSAARSNSGRGVSA